MKDIGARVRGVYSPMWQGAKMLSPSVHSATTRRQRLVTLWWCSLGHMQCVSCVCVCVCVCVWLPLSVEQHVYASGMRPSVLGDD